MTESASGVRLWTTIPPAKRSGGHPRQDDYQQLVRRTARMSEDAGFEGALVYSDNSSVDPWAVAQDVLLATDRFKPLVALQPVYLHPYTVAKTIASYGLLYDRSVCLNLVAGGNRADLAALDDTTEHDQRYDRLTEYARLITLLLEGGPVTFEGDYYRVRTLSLFPALPRHLLPELFISGSSEAGRRAGARLGALALRYPQPPGTGDPGPHNDLGGGGVRIGIIARDTDQEAWSVARDRFPDTRAGRMLQQLARNTSDSEWIARLSESEELPAGAGSPYWMGPFKTYATFCPYLVGSYERVAAEVMRYLDLGCGTFILDTARSESDYADITSVFSRALAQRVDTTPSPALAT